MIMMEKKHTRNSSIPSDVEAGPIVIPRQGIAIQLTNVSAVLGSHPVLDNVSVRIEGGTVTGIVGQSGSGKSTLLNLIGGFLTPDTGHVRFLRRYGVNIDERVHPAVGIALQNSPDLIPTLPIAQQVALPLLANGMAYRDAINSAEDALGECGLEKSTWKRTPSRLSGGQRQRVVIARLRLQRQDIILADEPSANLDATSAAMVLDLLVREAKEHGRTVLIVSHDEQEIHRVADAVYRCENGGLRLIPQRMPDRPNPTTPGVRKLKYTGSRKCAYCTPNVKSGRRPWNTNHTRLMRRI